jgi:hypothetical protein
MMMMYSSMPPQQQQKNNEEGVLDDADELAMMRMNWHVLLRANLRPWNTLSLPN